MTFTCNCRLHRRAGWFALRPAILLIVVKVLLIKSPKQRLETYCFRSVNVGNQFGTSLSTHKYNFDDIGQCWILTAHFRDLAAILKMADISKILKTLGHVWRLIVFAPFLIIIYYYYYFYYYYFSLFFLSFREPWTCPRQISGTTNHSRAPVFTPGI
jgi:hypothetical protein